MATLEAVLAQALELDTLDKVRLIEGVTPKIEEELLEAKKGTTPSHPSLWGVLQGLGTAPSVADIDEARQEMWLTSGQEAIG